MTIDKKIGFERLDGGETVRVHKGNKFQQDKAKFKMKIRGKKKVKWGKKKEQQNMRMEINYNINSSDLICTDLKDKK